MDTNFSNDDLAFRDEVRSFFKEEFDHDMAKRLADNHGAVSYTHLTLPTILLV